MGIDPNGARMRRAVSFLLLLLPLTAAIAPGARAYTTRVHIYLANQIREALMASGDNSITLLGSGMKVFVPPDDVAAIVTEPEAFRAGAIGPDNTMFPGMTDGTHAVGQRPYEQCELLYEAAILTTERAYALGCFLHGATDAIAHHYVNYLTGETFTLNPLVDDREEGWSNVVRHIVAESQVQKAVQDAVPDAFTPENVHHVIPLGFMLRNYFRLDSPLYGVLGHHAEEAFDEAFAAHPGLSLPELLEASDFAPVEHLILIPRYLEEFQISAGGFREGLVDRLAELQDHGSPDGSTLRVTAGADGQVGTWDDQTDCMLGCAQLYAEYFIHMGLLLKREDGWGDPLPAPYDVVEEKLRDDIAEFPLALVKTIQLFSSKLNSPLAESTDDFGVKSPEVNALFAPLDEWAAGVGNIDYKTLLYSVAPDVIVELDQILNNVGIDLTAILKAIVEPLIEQIKQALIDFVIERARTYVEELVTLIEEQKDIIIAEYDARLLAGSDPALGGHALDFWLGSGIYMHSFNIAAATFANHDVILPFGDDPLGIGPATFDASFTPDWSQAGLCENLREAIFPMGLGMKALLSVELPGASYPSPLEDDSPIECHDGDLGSFGEPSVANCAHTTLAELVEDPAHRGSITRAFPPEYGAVPAVCQGIEVPGLPMPLVGGGGVSIGSGGGDPPDAGDGDTARPGVGEAPGGAASPEAAGCSSASPRGASWLGLALLAGLFLRRRWR